MAGDVFCCLPKGVVEEGEGVMGPEDLCACVGPEGACPCIVRRNYNAEDDLWWHEVLSCSACRGRVLNRYGATHLCTDRTLWRVEPGMYQTTLTAQTPWFRWGE